jgi:hypothetical protein
MRAHGDHAAVGELEAVQAAQERGLAGAGGAADRHGFTVREREGDVTEYQRAVERFAQAYGLERDHGRAPRRASSARDRRESG